MRSRSRHRLFVVRSERTGLQRRETSSEEPRWFHITGNAGGNNHFASRGTDSWRTTERRYAYE